MNGNQIRIFNQIQKSNPCHSWTLIWWHDDLIFLIFQNVKESKHEGQWKWIPMLRFQAQDIMTGFFVWDPTHVLLLVWQHQAISLALCFPFYNHNPLFSKNKLAKFAKKPLPKEQFLHSIVHLVCIAHHCLMSQPPHQNSNSPFFPPHVTFGMWRTEGERKQWGEG